MKGGVKKVIKTRENGGKNLIYVNTYKCMLGYTITFVDGRYKSIPVGFYFRSYDKLMDRDIDLAEIYIE